MSRIMKPSVLFELAKRILVGMGCTETEAVMVAEHMLESNMQGHDSHGVQMLMLYDQGVKSGRMKGGVKVDVVEDGPVLRVNAGHGNVHSFGHRSMREAVDLGIKKAEKEGVAIISYQNGGHVGRLGTYGQQVTDKMLMGVFLAGIGDHSPTVAVHGGSEPVVCTNPLCIALPSRGLEEGVYDFVLDFATSKVALNKIRNMIAKGMVTIPEGLILDHQGRPSTNPKDVVSHPRGAILSFGAHKGSGLALAIELIANGLTGYGTNHPSQPRHCTPEDQSPVNNVFAIILNPLLLGGSLAELAKFMKFVSSSRRRDPSMPIYLPGEPEQLTKIERAKNGIPVPHSVLTNLLKLCKEYNVPDAEVDRILNPPSKL
eukprot:TRINITY_DN1564_c0_g1_i2.p1 TRINITY_DN1564_c0_g1~~TRINITY_DN1564_c0_g1_i2.p1  ORF type:complete len:388 (+),score=75.18 TRINITY_DN1564_c0_g1_i2:50-1165(+)